MRIVALVAVVAVLVAGGFWLARDRDTVADGSTTNQATTADAGASGANASTPPPASSQAQDSDEPDQAPADAGGADAGAVAPWTDSPVMGASDPSATCGCGWQAASASRAASANADDVAAPRMRLRTYHALSGSSSRVAYVKLRGSVGAAGPLVEQRLLAAGERLVDVGTPGGQLGEEVVLHGAIALAAGQPE